MSNHNASVSIVVPTYNERENISELLERIQRTMEPLQDPFEILIVDDDSPDETWKVASSFSDSYPVRVIRRNGKRGLAPSVLDGIRASKYDTIVVIDADLQHPPETIPKLVSEVRNGTDIAIASRFVDIKERRYTHALKKTMPCEFLGEDERCRIYSDRPKVCADFPFVTDFATGKVVEIRLFSFCNVPFNLVRREVTRRVRGDKV
jgi:glycosyltransferase involved in cell wall biosynthesis